MRILRLSQGSPEWHQHRATRCNASDAPAMLGESPHMTRDELLQRMATGLAPEVDAGTQRRFDDGHAVEVLLRAQAEKMLGEPLYAFVGVPDDEESLLSASFDGSTFVGDTTVECKLLNARLRAAFADMETIAPAHREKTAAKSLPIDYRIQLEQQVRVAASDRALFLAGELRDDGTLGDTFSCWYYPDDELWQRIVKGWYQFLDDRATYAPREAAPKAVAAPVESLPAVSIRMEGALTVRSNLQTLGPILRAFIEKIPVQPTTDQEFADTDAACKALKKIEDALDAEENSALSELAEVEEMRRLKADLHALARTTRLQREKLVKARKDQIRIEMLHQPQFILPHRRASSSSTCSPAAVAHRPASSRPSAATLTSRSTTTRKPSRCTRPTTRRRCTTSATFSRLTRWRCAMAGRWACCGARPTASTSRRPRAASRCRRRFAGSRG
jgi:putative phage-type endonuclease